MPAVIRFDEDHSLRVQEEATALAEALQGLAWVRVTKLRGGEAWVNGATVRFVEDHVPRER